MHCVFASIRKNRRREQRIGLHGLCQCPIAGILYSPTLFSNYWSWHQATFLEPEDGAQGPWEEDDFNSGECNHAFGKASSGGGWRHTSTWEPTMLSVGCMVRRLHRSKLTVTWNDWCGPCWHLGKIAGGGSPPIKFYLLSVGVHLIACGHSEQWSCCAVVNWGASDHFPKKSAWCAANMFRTHRIEKNSSLAIAIAKFFCIVKNSTDTSLFCLSLNRLVLVSNLWHYRL